MSGDRRKAETKLQRAIIDALELQGLYVLRTNSGVVKVKRGFMHLGRKGTPDIHLAVPPRARLGALECKMPGEKPEPEQEERKAALERAGALHAFVSSVPEAIAVVCGWCFAERGP